MAEVVRVAGVVGVARGGGCWGMAVVVGVA